MQAKVHSRRLFYACVVSIGLGTLVPHSGKAGTPDTLSKDFSRSAFSTTSILSDLTNNHKQLPSTEIAPLSTGRVSISSEEGAFQYESETRQTPSARRLSDEIRATQELENQRNAEITEHPFWHAPFWTHSPLAIVGFLMGGDHRAVETPPTQFEKLGAADHCNDAEVRKFERSVSFGNVGSRTRN